MKFNGYVKYSVIMLISSSETSIPTLQVTTKLSLGEVRAAGRSMESSHLSSKKHFDSRRLLCLRVVVIT